MTSFKIIQYHKINSSFLIYCRILNSPIKMLNQSYCKDIRHHLLLPKIRKIEPVLKCSVSKRNWAPKSENPGHYISQLSKFMNGSSGESTHKISHLRASTERFDHHRIYNSFGEKSMGVITLKNLQLTNKSIRNTTGIHPLKSKVSKSLLNFSNITSEKVGNVMKLKQLKKIHPMRVEEIRKLVSKSAASLSHSISQRSVKKGKITQWIKS